MPERECKQFHLGDILSITTGVLVSPRGMDGVYDILNFMTSESLFTHQLPRAGRICGPALLRQHPELLAVKGEVFQDAVKPFANDKQAAGDAIDGLVKEKVAAFGEYLSVKALSLEEYVAIDPVEEAVALMGKERVIVVTTE
jgi:hypothetical protein